MIALQSDLCFRPDRMKDFDEVSMICEKFRKAHHAKFFLAYLGKGNDRGNQGG